MVPWPGWKNNNVRNSITESTQSTFNESFELKEVEDDQNEQHAIVTLGSYLEQLQRKGQVLSELDNKIFELFTKPEDLEADI